MIMEEDAGMAVALVENPLSIGYSLQGAIPDGGYRHLWVFAV